MFLIDRPFASKFLIQTIKDNNYQIVSTQDAFEYINDESLNWISEAEAVHILENAPNTPVYTNSENVVAWIDTHLSGSKLVSQIQIFKNKIKFRDLVQDSFPGFFYKPVNLKDILELKLKGIDFPFVIKPSLGFFSLDVHIINDITDWNTVKRKLSTKATQSIFPEEVLNTSTFIIEKYIEGDEYAIDCYFNKDGEAVILNILHHRFSSKTDISDRLYSTSKEILLGYKTPIEAFIQSLGDKTGLRNFPLHVEIRIDSHGRIHPIEINPLRFGGYCTTGDLSWYAFGFNSYEYYIKNKKPNWEQVFQENEDNTYSIVILNNTTGYTASDIANFDYDLLLQDFEKVLTLRKLSIEKHSLFGYMFIQNSRGKKEELDNILTSNLRKYVDIKL